MFNNIIKFSFLIRQNCINDSNYLMRNIEYILYNKTFRHEIPKHTSVIKTLDCIKRCDVKCQPWRQFLLSGLPEDSIQQWPSADVPAQNKLSNKTKAL